MPNDYTTAGGGLKLKGAAPTGIVKKKKKKAKPSAEISKHTSSADDTADTTKPDTTVTQQFDHTTHPDTTPASHPTARSDDHASRPKTAAERNHEERKRKRLEEKMRKEGGRTHKQKVEELNRYLSGLSEHHDMPKIGPG